MENVGSIDGIILPSHWLWISVDKGSSFVLSPLKHTALELFLAAVASWLPYDDSMKWPNPESLPLTSLYIPSQDNEEPHPSIWLVSWALPQPMVSLGILDITVYHCAHQHGLVGAEGGHETMFSPLTPLCVWFWGVVIQGHGVSSYDPQTFLQCPLFFDLYVHLKHSCLLHPCMNLYQTLFTANLFLRVV